MVGSGRSEDAEERRIAWQRDYPQRGTIRPVSLRPFRFDETDRTFSGSNLCMPRVVPRAAGCAVDLAATTAARNFRSEKRYTQARGYRCKSVVPGEHFSSSFSGKRRHPTQAFTSPLGLLAFLASWKFLCSFIADCRAVLVPGTGSRSSNGNGFWSRKPAGRSLAFDFCHFCNSAHFFTFLPPRGA